MTATLVPTGSTRADERGIHVDTTWSGVPLDRPSTGGWLLGPKDGKLADRLVRAIAAGVVYSDPKVETDVDGKTFVSARSHVLGRMMNADLRRLGF